MKLSDDTVSLIVTCAVRDHSDRTRRQFLTSPALLRGNCGMDMQFRGRKVGIGNPLISYRLKLRLMVITDANQRTNQRRSSPASSSHDIHVPRDG